MHSLYTQFKLTVYARSFYAIYTHGYTHSLDTQRKPVSSDVPLPAEVQKRTYGRVGGTHAHVVHRYTPTVVYIYIYIYI